MAYSPLNVWIIVHFISFCFTVTASMLYIMCFTQECFEFVVSLAGDSEQIKKLEKIVTNLHLIKEPSEIFVVVMKYLGSYAFLLQFFVAMLFATFACSHFGERKVLVSIRDSGESYTVIVETNSTRK